MQAADLDAVAVRLADAAARGDDPTPDAATFMLRAYQAEPGDEAGGALGASLARALDAARDDTAPAARAAWLALFVEAAPIADDERILQAAGELVDLLRAAWPADSTTAERFVEALASVDACLHASAVLDPSAIVQPAVDELERLVGSAYQPGQLLGARAFQAGGGAGVLDAHVAAASALLTAFDVTARLPYSMLAEELMQPLRRAPAAGAARDCAAARVFCRLARLHDDADYRAAAVLAPDADYRADAARMLQAHGAQAREGQLTDAARYGLALGELLSLR